MNYDVLIFLGLFLAVLFLLLFIRRKKGIKKCEYDERQAAIQGTAYKYAALTGIFGGIIAGLIVDADLLPITGGFALIMVSFLMIEVYVIFMILKGAYFGITGSWKRWTISITLFGVANLYFGIKNIATDVLEDGCFTICDINLPLGILFLVIAATLSLSSTIEILPNTMTLFTYSAKSPSSSGWSSSTVKMPKASPGSFEPEEALLSIIFNTLFCRSYGPQSSRKASKDRTPLSQPLQGQE